MFFTLLPNPKTITLVMLTYTYIVLKMGEKQERMPVK